MTVFTPEGFYDSIADKYHWFFSSWDNRMESQIKHIKPILEKYGVKTVLDCSCGSGLQAIGLAKEGYEVEGGDLSANMIDKAKQSAVEAGVSINFKQVDFRNLKQYYSGEYDAVISWGNSIPHLMNDADILLALRNIYSCTKSGGIALFELRNYDLMLKEKPRFSPMRINDVKDNIRYSIIYVFDYLDSKIRFNILYLIEDLKTGEKRMETESVDYNPVRKAQFMGLLRKAGFKKISVEENNRNIRYVAEK